MIPAVDRRSRQRTFYRGSEAQEKLIEVTRGYAMNVDGYHIAVVIPAYQAQNTIRAVIEKLPEFIRTIVVVDDCSRDDTAQIVERMAATDTRIHLIRHEHNTGVGGAVLDGFHAAYDLGADLIVKMDSDDQMDARYLLPLIKPILSQKADYTKGNRFLHTVELRQMPLIRRVGNIVLSFLTKLSSGYWNIFDPTNGYIAIHASLMPWLREEKIHKRFFFEISMLLQLGLVRAVVKDVYIPARYGEEKSTLSEFEILTTFPFLLLKGFIERGIVQYFIRDFNVISLFILTSLPLTLFGFIFGIYHWWLSATTGIPATTGTVMVATIPFVLGLELLLQSLVLDIQNVPTTPIQDV